MAHLSVDTWAKKIMVPKKEFSALSEEDGEYVERPYDTENGIYRGHSGRVEAGWRLGGTESFGP